MTPGSVASSSSQWLRGVLDLCLLAVVREGPAYGYEMTRRLADRGLLIVADGSIYPALGRLERDGLLSSYTEPAPGGPPRKYYQLTRAGRAALVGGQREWSAFVAGVAAVLDLKEVG